MWKYLCLWICGVLFFFSGKKVKSDPGAREPTRTGTDEDKLLDVTSVIFNAKLLQ